MIIGGGGEDIIVVTEETGTGTGMTIIIMVMAGIFKEETTEMTEEAEMTEVADIVTTTIGIGGGGAVIIAGAMVVAAETTGMTMMITVEDIEAPERLKGETLWLKDKESFFFMGIELLMDSCFSDKISNGCFI